jgi:hypothetical protein
MTTPSIAVIDRSLRCPLGMIDVSRRCLSGVIDISRRCPSGARQSPGGEADPVLERSPLRRLPLVKASGTCVDDDSVDCWIVRRLRCPLGVIDVSLPCPSGARQSPGGEADGDCGTGCVSLRTTAHDLEGSHQAFRSLRSAATDGHPRFPQAHASHSHLRHLEVENTHLHQRERPQARPLKPRERPQARPPKPRERPQARPLKPREPPQRRPLKPRRPATRS